MDNSTPPTLVAEQVTQYLETALQLIKYKGIDKASAVIAEVITGLFMAVLVLLTFILLSITLALLAGHLLNSNWEGFACVTGFYALLAIIARLLKISLQNLFIRQFIQRVFRQKKSINHQINQYQNGSEQPA